MAIYQWSGIYVSLFNQQKIADQETKADEADVTYRNAYKGSSQESISDTQVIHDNDDRETNDPLSATFVCVCVCE